MKKITMTMMMMIMLTASHAKCRCNLNGWRASAPSVSEFVERCKNTEKLEAVADVIRNAETSKLVTNMDNEVMIRFQVGDDWVVLDGDTPETAIGQFDHEASK